MQKKSLLPPSILNLSYNSLLRAISICGGVCNFARILGVEHFYVSLWKNRDKRISKHFVLQAEKATGNKVTRYQLRPDLYSRKGKKP